MCTPLWPRTAHDTFCERSRQRASRSRIERPVATVERSGSGRAVADETGVPDGETGADGLMIGRAAQGRPWIFREINHFRATGRHLPEPQPAWIRDLLLEHLEALYGIYGREHGVKVARKHIAWYCRTQPGAAAFRQRINRAATTEEQSRLIRDYFGGLNDKKTPGHGPVSIEEAKAA